MKCIQNRSFQGIEIYLETSKGAKTIWLSPREIVTVPDFYLSKQVKNLQKRKMVSIYDA